MAETPAEKGLACPACGCHHLLVLRTRPHTGGRVMRQRECRNCGRRLITYESLPDRQGWHDLADMADLSESQKKTILSGLLQFFGRVF